MPRRSIYPQSRRHLWLYDDDWRFIERFIAQQSRLSPGSWCREVIHKVVQQIREDQTARVELATPEPLLDSVDMELPEIPND